MDILLVIGAVTSTQVLGLALAAGLLRLMVRALARTAVAPDPE